MTINPWICKWCGFHNPETYSVCTSCGRELKRINESGINNVNTGTKSK